MKPSVRGREVPESSDRRPVAPFHVILIGLPGSGKSTVGPIVASQLGLPFVDVDDQIERAVGLAVPAILAKLGEQCFRALESQAVEKYASQVDPMVISPGGGWAAHGDNLTGVRKRALTVYLKTSPPIAARRVIRSGGRPLLTTGAEVESMELLLRKREVHYGGADAVVATDGRGPAEVAAEVVQLARISGPV